MTKKKIALIVLSCISGSALGVTIGTAAANWIITITGLLFAIPFGLLLQTWAEGIVNS